MSWFKVDDTAHSHPKMLRAGNAALGLWLRAGAYAAQHLTEGVVPGVVAQLYGTAPQARKLVAAGLWHEHGHACPHPQCRQPAPGDFYVHDYLVYNPTRARVEGERTAAAERQKRARERANETRKRARNADESRPNRERNGDETDTENHESTPNQIVFPELFAGQDVSSQRDDTKPSRSPRPDPTRPPVPPTEVQQASRDGSTAPAVPDALLPLRDALTAAGIVVEWSLDTGDWFRLAEIAARTSTAALVDHAREQWRHARSRPRSVRYFLPGWTALPPVPHGAPTAPGADVIPLAAARPGRVARAAHLFRTAALDDPTETAQ
ncbi:mucin-2 [Streptomyces sp. CH6]|uniref:mucin-2 n=1 Tax=unclassified Streptomyces TaxID=2593676 RepID=UPI003D02497F